MEQRKECCSAEIGKKVTSSTGCDEMGQFVLLLVAAAIFVPEGVSLTCQCSSSPTPGRTLRFCDIERPQGCGECEGDAAAERAYRQLEAILSRLLDVVMQGRDKNCCLVSINNELLVITTCSSSSVAKEYICTGHPYIWVLHMHACTPKLDLHVHSRSMY